MRTIAKIALFVALMSSAAFAQTSGTTPPPPPVCSSSNAGQIYTNTSTSPATVYTCSYYNLSYQWIVNPSYGGLVYYPTLPTTCSGALPMFVAGYPQTQVYVCQNGTPTVVEGQPGPPGPAGPAGTLNWRGAWTPNTAYAKNDAYTYSGISYVVLTAYTSGASYGSLDTANASEISTGCALTGCTMTGALNLNVPLAVGSGGTGATTPNAAMTAFGITQTGSGSSQVDTFPGAIVSMVDNGYVNATTYNGSDIGAQINAACESFPVGGSVNVPQGTYSFATPIVISNLCNIRGQGKGATVLIFTPTSGTAITYSGGADSSVAGYGISDLTLQGAGVSGSTATGLLVSYPGFVANNVEIGSPGKGFDVGVTFGSNSYNDRFVNSEIWQNNQNLVYPSGLSNSGENIAFFHTSFGNGQLSDGVSPGVNCVNILGSNTGSSNAELNFYSDSFDGCQVVIGTNPLHTNFFTPHFEDVQTYLDYPFLSISSASNYSSVTLSSPTFFVDASTMTAKSFVQTSGYANLSVPTGAVSYVYGGTSNPTIAAFYLTGSGQATFNSGGVFSGNDGGSFPKLYATDGTNNAIINTKSPSSNNFVAVPSTGGTIVVASSSASNMSGHFQLVYIGPNRYESMSVNIVTGNYAQSDLLTVLSDWSYGSNYVLNPEILGNAAAGSQTSSQFAVVISNQGGNGGTLYVQWYGDSLSHEIILPSTTPYTNVIPTSGLAILGSTLSFNGSPVSTANSTGAAIVPVTIGASPFTYTFTTRGQLCVVGGTPTIIDIIRGSTVNTGQTQGCFYGLNGDEVQITYTGTPTLNFIPE